MFKSISFFVFFSLVSFGLFSQSSILLEVVVIGIPNNDGQMIVSLHQGPENYPKAPIEKKMGVIENGKSVVIFELASIGDYAITAIHDENGNDKLDFNFIHMPTENAVASNNAKGFMGPPKYDNTKINIVENTQIVLPLTKVHNMISDNPANEH